MLRYVSAIDATSPGRAAGAFLDIATDDPVTADRVAAEYAHVQGWRRPRVKRGSAVMPNVRVTAAEVECVLGARFKRLRDA